MTQKTTPIQSGSSASLNGGHAASVGAILLFAFGAAAETAGLGEQLKANTVNTRVLSLARIGNYFLQTSQLALACAIAALLELPT